MREASFDDQQSKAVTDGKINDQGATSSEDVVKKSNDVTGESLNQGQGKEREKDHETVQDDQESNPKRKASDHTMTNKPDGPNKLESKVDQSDFKNASESDHEMPHDDQENSSTISKEKCNDQSLGNKQEQADQGEALENDDKVTCDQKEATLQQDNQSANLVNTKSEVITDQDEVKSPSTPPHMINKSACSDSQATEIIDNDTDDSQASDDKSDHKYQTPTQSNSDKDSKQYSSDDDDERQYGRPWYQFWGSSKSSVSSYITMTS